MRSRWLCTGIVALVLVLTSTGAADSPLRRWLQDLHFRLPDQQSLVLVNKSMLHLNGSFTSIVCAGITAQTISSAYTPPSTAIMVGAYKMTIGCNASVEMHVSVNHRILVLYLASVPVHVCLCMFV
jgi:hypothetical protein